MERSATPEETAKIKALLTEAVGAGAFGFTTTNAAQHIGYHGRPLACRQADRAEFTAYCNALKELGRSEEHTSELQSLMRISYAVFCVKQKIHKHLLKHTHK